VHEKSILLPLLPLSLLALEQPLLACWLPPLAAFSMYPLLQRDGATLAYIGLNLLYAAAMQLLLPAVRQGRKGQGSRWPGLVVGAVTLAALGLHAAKVAAPAPARYPWLWDRAFISLSFAVFAPVVVYLNVRQWQLPADATGAVQKRKQS
jgi:alpha-1,3-glucosyltransferase